jgi:hypothetical protein
MGEPRYTDEHTVTVSLRYPHLCCHLPSERCAFHEPHAVIECGEWEWPEGVVVHKTSAEPLAPW